MLFWMQTRLLTFGMLLQNDGLDIKVFPEFMHIQKDGIQMSGLTFNIIVENAI